MKTYLLLMLSGCAALAACGGGTLDVADGAKATASKVEWTLLDDEGRFMPSLPGATPDTASVRARALRYASATQAEALAAALGPRALRVDLDAPGGGAEALALALSAHARATAGALVGLPGLPEGLPVLVQSRDLQQATAVATQLSDAGLKGVWVVRS